MVTGAAAGKACALAVIVRNGFAFDVIGAVLIVIGVPVMVSVLGIGG